MTIVAALEPTASAEPSEPQPCAEAPPSDPATGSGAAPHVGDDADDTEPLTGTDNTEPLTGDEDTEPITGDEDTEPLTGDEDTEPITGDETTRAAADTTTEAGDPIIDSAPATDGEQAGHTEQALRFADLALPNALLRAVDGLGFVTPSPIQAAAIPPLLAGRDITGVAQTGTGKTAAFGLPLLAAIDPRARIVQALVLAPTRELAMQVAEALRSFASHLPDVAVTAIYGGAPFGPQLADLRSGAQIVVGTPGRIIDHLERGTLDLSALRFLVLDEADEMLRMGFAEDVDRILSDAPTSRQTALFSATMPGPIRRIAGQHLVDPVDISVARQASTVEGVRQTYAVVPYRHKVDVLTRILQVAPADATIVFVRTKGASDEVGAELQARGLSAAAINGDVPQKERERIIERLREGRLDVLVATDVAARGLDVDRVDLVVNFDAPLEPESYVHRIGRTGRAGRTGEALTFFTPREVGRLRAIERVTRQRLEQITPPTDAQVTTHRAASILTSATTRTSAGNLAEYRQAVAGYLAEHDLTAEDLAGTLLALAVGDDGTRAAKPEPEETGGFESSRGTKRRGDRPARASERGSAERGGRRRAPAGTRYRVAVGHRDGVGPGSIVGAITGEGGLNGSDIGRIDIFESFSLVEFTTDVSPAVLQRISAAKVAGRALHIAPDTGARRRAAAHAPGSHGPRGSSSAARRGEHRAPWDRRVPSR